MLPGNGDGILGDNSFTGGCERGNEDTVALFESVDGSLLEVVEFKGVRDGGVGDHLLEAGHVDLVLDEPLLSLAITDSALYLLQHVYITRG